MISAATTLTDPLIPSCFICTEGDRCDLIALSGGLLSSVVQNGEVWIEIQGNGGCESVRVADRWHSQAQRLTALANRADRASITVRFLHLDRLPDGRFAMRPTSLLVIDPDRLIDISSLDGTEYCLRSWFARRLAPDAPSIASIRGTIVHACFGQMMANPTQRPSIFASLPTALAAQTLAMALLPNAVADLPDKVRSHLSHLSDWAATAGFALVSQNERQPRSETLLLCPELGLRGRIDLLALDSAGVQVIIELKTGKHNPSYPGAHFQTHGYQAILHAQQRHAPSLTATVLYTGALVLDQHRIDYSLPSVARVITMRNMAVLAEWWDLVPATGSGAQCAKAFRREDCDLISHLLSLGACQGSAASDIPSGLSAADWTFYAQFYQLLRLEQHASQSTLQRLWRATAEERIADGSALAVKPVLPVADGNRWLYQFASPTSSDVRVGDNVLLSNGDPIRGSVAAGFVVALNNDGITINTGADVLEPCLIDHYDSDHTSEQMLRNLALWLTSVRPERRALIYGNASPRFGDDLYTTPPSLNDMQARAVVRALQARDYMLLQGPPGTGKTTVLAHIVHALVERGQRVLLAGWTNAAVDTMLLALLKVGLTNICRLGPTTSLTPQLQPFHILAPSEVTNTRSEASPPAAAEVARRLATIPILATTIATWSHPAYTDQSLGNPDIVIVDEAAQVTIPAVLGVLRLAKRFILVGDDRQLPAVVRSEEAAAGGLGESLFARLRPIAEQHDGLVSLTEQYRMAAHLCAYPSAAFYGGSLRAHPSVTERDLAEFCPAWRSRALVPWLRRALDPARRLVIIDVPHLDSERDMARQSVAEAYAVIDLMRGLRRIGVPDNQIGVIAPFRAQVALIQRLAQQRHLPATMTIDTVDRFQGGEREVMIISLAGTTTTARGHSTFLDSPHRFNVALTRARSKLIVLGDVQALAHVTLLHDLIAHHGGARTVQRHRQSIPPPGLHVDNIV